MIKHISLIIIILCILSCGGEVRKGNTGLVYKNGEILVKFKANVNDMQKHTAHRMLKAQVIKRAKLEGLERIKLPDDVSVKEAVRLYKENPDVEYAEPNYLVRAAAIPDDTRFNMQWYLHNTGQIVNGVVGTADADIDAPEAWEITKGNSSVIVAVIDSGVDKNHPDLTDNLLTGYDFVANDNNPADLNGHGTHVAGIIGAVSNNARGITGVSWNVKIMPLKALDKSGEGNIFDIIDAIAFAASNNAKIINMSFSGPAYSQALYNSIKTYPDILFVVAAGNGGEDGAGDNNDLIPQYPASFNLPNIITVASIDQNGNLSSFSNYGPASVDIAAPGANILSTVPSFITGITYSGLYRVVYLSYGFEGINGAASRKDVMQRVLSFAGVLNGNSILIVDDDGGSLYETYYKQSLQALGYAFDYYEIPFNTDGPATDKLGQYNLVIWFTGDEYRNTLTLTDQANLQSYLDKGGSLFITGQDIGFDIGLSEFFQNYLHAIYVKDDANGSFFHGLNIFLGLFVDLPLAYGDGAKNQFSIDVVDPSGSAAAFSIHYDDAYQFFTGTSMSTAVVSGVAALVASYYGTFDANRIKSVILSSAEIIQSLQGKISTNGRINALRALTALLPPSELIATPQAGGKVLLTWADTSTAEEGFTIERKRSGDQFREIASVSSGNTSYTDNGLEAGTYTYKVRGFISQAFSSYSDEVSVTVQEGAKAGGGGGGGGCSLGNTLSHQTATADTIVLFTPLFIIWIMRRRRIQGSKGSSERLERKNL